MNAPVAETRPRRTLSVVEAVIRGVVRALCLSAGLASTAFVVRLWWLRVDGLEELEDGPELLILFSAMGMGAAVVTAGFIGVGAIARWVSHRWLWIPGVLFVAALLCAMTVVGTGSTGLEGS